MGKKAKSHLKVVVAVRPFLYRRVSNLKGLTMTRISLILASLGMVVLLSLGCGGEDPKNMTKEQVFEKMKTMFSGFVDVAKANKGNCGGLADAMDKMIEENKGVALRAKELEKDAEAKKWMDEQGKKMMEEMGPKLMELMPIMAECKDDEKFKKVNEKFENMMK